MHFPSYLKKPRGFLLQCVYKYRQGWRPVIHLKRLNSHIDAPHFCIFTISSVLSTIKTWDFAFRIDLEETYFHILIRKDTQRYLHFAFMYKMYQFRYPLWSQHSFSGAHSPGAHYGGLPPLSGNLSASIHRRLVGTSPGPRLTGTSQQPHCMKNHI